MEVNYKNLLLGVKLDSYNRGVNALAIGGINYIKSNFNQDSILIVNIGSKASIERTVLINNRNFKIISKSFSLRNFIKSCLTGLLFRFFKRKPKDELSKLIYHSEIAYNLNEGDSFSDLYGKYRFFSHFFVSLALLAWMKKLVFLPQTVGPFKTIYGKTLASYILKRLDKLLVRDTAADNFLDKRNIQREYNFDVACKMQPRPVNFDYFSLDSFIVGININALMYFNAYGFSKYSNRYQQLLKKIVDFCLSKEYKVLLIPHTYDIENKFSENDYESIRDFVNKNNYINNDNIAWVSNDYDAQEIKSIISNVRIFIGSRMHACIAALSTNVPTIGVAYSYKFKGTFSNFNQEDFVLDIKQISEVQIIDKVATLIENKKNIVEQLKEINEKI
ncbi:MAG TPA: polysaccharide pyruvyl transferase family protein [Bacteroidales bacterium]|nr:polysaccharide pyruvyl transferase family protein [Bacteroidales bacterium]